jgi:hypothetical protein
MRTLTSSSRLSTQKANWGDVEEWFAKLYNVSLEEAEYA